MISPLLSSPALSLAKRTLLTRDESRCSSGVETSLSGTASKPGTFVCVSAMRRPAKQNGSVPIGMWTGAKEERSAPSNRVVRRIARVAIRMAMRFGTKKVRTAIAVRQPL